MKDAYYFPHFCNARHDRKIKRVTKELGVEGYGIYFMVLEVLREQTDFKYPLSEIDLLAYEFGTSEQKVRVVICNYGLFEVDENNNFFSLKLVEFMQPYLKMKAQRVNAGKASAEKRKQLSQQPFNDRSTTVQQSKVKESKVKESKLIPTFEEFKQYAIENKQNVCLDSLKLKYDSWVLNDWKDGNDKEIKKWKPKLLNTLPYIKEKQPQQTTPTPTIKLGKA
jgi:hypothetical protein